MIRDIRRLNEEQRVAEKRMKEVSKNAPSTNFKYSKKDSFSENILSQLHSNDADAEGRMAGRMFEGGDWQRHRLQQFARREKREYDDLMRKITFGADDGYDYKDSPTLKPCSQFFQHLVKARFSDAGLDPDEKNVITPTRVRLRIPPTFVMGIAEHNVMFYTDTSGCLCRCDAATPKTFRVACGFKYKDAGFESPGAGGGTAAAKLQEAMNNAPPVTVVKRPKYGQNCNDLHIMNIRQTKLNISNTATGLLQVSQKFIRTRGPSATLTRLVWSDGKGSIGYQISNKIRYEDAAKEKDLSKRYIATTENPKSLSVFLMKGSALKELEQMTAELATHMTNTVKPRPRFETLVCDFTKDEEGVWWFLQVKAFKLLPENPHLSLGTGEGASTTAPGSPTHNHTDGSPMGGQQGTVSKRGAVFRSASCGICGENYKPEDLQYTLTLKMISGIEKHLKRHGKYRKWFDRPALKHTDSPLWYQPRRVCKACFDLYMREQKLEQAELLFAKAIGIPVDSDQQEIASVLTAYNRKCQQLSNPRGSRMYSAPVEKKGRSSAGSSLVPRCATAGTRLRNQAPSIATVMTLYRMVMFFYEVHNLPSSIEGPLFLKVDFLYTSLKLPIRTHPPNDSSTVTPVQKLRMLHFFTEIASALAEGGEEEGGEEPGSPNSGSKGQFGSQSHTSGGSPTGGAAAQTHAAGEGSKANGTKSNPHLRNFIRQQKELVIQLWQPAIGSIGQCHLPLHQFEGGLIEKLDYVKLIALNIPTANDQLCYLRVTLGVIRGRSIPTDDIPLRRHPSGVYVPSEEFYSVDALPEEWMQLVIGNEADMGGDSLPQGEGSAAQYNLAAGVVSERSVSLAAANGSKSGKTAGGGGIPKDSFTGWKASWTNNDRLGGKNRHQRDRSLQRNRGTIPVGNPTVTNTSAKLRRERRNRRTQEEQEQKERVKNRSNNIPTSPHGSRNSPSPRSPLFSRRGRNRSPSEPASPTRSDRQSEPPAGEEAGEEAEHQMRTSSTRSGFAGPTQASTHMGDPAPSLGGDRTHSMASFGSGGAARMVVEDCEDENSGFPYQSGFGEAEEDGEGRVVPIIGTALARQLQAAQKPAAVWVVQVHVQTITDLYSPLDESWVVEYNFLGQTITHETFQLFEGGSLTFDAERTFYVHSLESGAFLRYLKDLGRLKMSLMPKYNVMTVRESEVSLLPLISEASQSAVKGSAWTGTAIQGLFGLASRATLQIDKDSGRGSSSGVMSMGGYGSEENMGDPNDEREGGAGTASRERSETKNRGSSRGQRKQAGDSPSPQSRRKQIRVFRLTDDIDEEEEEEFLLQEAKRRQIASQNDGRDGQVGASMMKSYSIASAGGDEDSDGTSSMGEDGRSEAEEEAKPQLALVLKLSKVFTSLDLHTTAVGSLSTQDGPIVLLSTI